MSAPLRLSRAPRRARVLGLLVLAAVFLAGGLAGAAADRALRERSHGEGGRRSHRGLEGQVFERLELNAGQRAELERIFERRRHEAGAVWDEVKPRLQRVMDGTRDDLARVLDSGQLAEYDRIVAERQRHRDGRYKGESDRGKRKPS